MNAERQGQENGGWYTSFPTIGRAGNRVLNLTGRGRGLRPASPSHPGRDLLAVARGKGRSLRPTSPSNVGRTRNFHQIGGGKKRP